MSRVPMPAAVVGAVGVAASLFLVLPASAAQRSSAVSCTQKVKSHSYHVTPVGLSCPKASKYVKRLAAEKLKSTQSGERLSWQPKGFSCAAYANSKHVQTFGNCSSSDGSKSFTWALIQ